jgi:hypothetical protein
LVVVVVFVVVVAVVATCEYVNSTRPPVAGDCLDGGLGRTLGSVSEFGSVGECACCCCCGRRKSVVVVWGVLAMEANERKLLFSCYTLSVFSRLMQ